MSAVAPKGWREIPIKTVEGGLIAVITRPCAGANWFVHHAGWKPKQKFRTKRAAYESLGLFGKPLD